MTDALIIFVRTPELGKVKTRLAATLGNEAALSIYRRLLEHTYTVAAQSLAHKFVFYAGEIPATDLWAKEGITRLPQPEGDLGERMLSAFREVFERGGEKVVIIGSDCPGLKHRHLQQAFVLLNEKDIVVGPSKDGGYYLLGMKRLHSCLFRNMKWSTASVYKDTLHEIEKQRLTFATLDVLADVDEEADLPQEWRING